MDQLQPCSIFVFSHFIFVPFFLFFAFFSSSSSNSSSSSFPQTDANPILPQRAQSAKERPCNRESRAPSRQQRRRPKTP
jgi:hypothetical protein